MFYGCVVDARRFSRQKWVYPRYYNKQIDIIIISDVTFSACYSGKLCITFAHNNRKSESCTNRVHHFHADSLYRHKINLHIIISHTNQFSFKMPCFCVAAPCQRIVSAYSTLLLYYYCCHCDTTCAFSLRASFTANSHLTHLQIFKLQMINRQKL